MAEPKRIISLVEVKEHSTAKSLWLAIHNKVYDVTKFMDEHPGGEEVLLEQGGQIASDSFEDVGHSEDARELMKDYCIGELADEDKEPEKEKSDEKESGNTSSAALSWLIPAAISVGIIAVAFYKWMSS